jgi:hypothetical protein
MSTVSWAYDKLVIGTSMAMQERRVPLVVVFVRITAVTGIGFAAALGIFLLLGGFWQAGLISLAAVLFFLFLMFYIERYAERALHD